MFMHHPEKDHDYLMTVDVARGVGNDYSAFTSNGYYGTFPHSDGC